MRRTKITGYMLLAVFFVSLVPYAAEAASITVKPHHFKPCVPSDTNNWQTPSEITGSAGYAKYYAVVNLPVGRRVTKLVSYHKGSGGAFTEVGLYRVRIGEKYDQIASLNTNLNTGGAFVPVTTTTITHPVVAAGYTYYVWTEVGTNNQVNAVKVKYQ